jgi:predicted nuclease of predicted toxin-antitoxin system
MKIKLDENIPAGLAPILAELSHDVDTVLQEGLGGAADPEVWQAAQQEERFFVTQDLDFSDPRQFAPGTHHGLLLVRLRDPSRTKLIQLIRNVFQNEQVEQWAGCLVVATERKTRVRGR